MTESRMQGFAAGRYAAIDIGTVTCRMLVADVDAAGAIHEVDREYAITNLGEARRCHRYALACCDRPHR